MILIRKNTKQTYFAPKEPFKNVSDVSNEYYSWIFKGLSCFYGYETIHCSFNDLIKILGSDVKLDSNGSYRWYMKYEDNKVMNAEWFFSIYSKKQVKNKDKKIDWLLVTAEKYQAYFVYETINNLL